MSTRTTRSSQRRGRAVDDATSNQPASTRIGDSIQSNRREGPQVSASAPATVAPDANPNRRYNPDVLLTIAECLMNIKHYETVISLSCVSQYFADSLKPFRKRMRKQVILKLEDLDLDAKSGWDAVK